MMTAIPLLLEGSEKGVSMNETNWAGNYAYRATRLHRPETMDELRKIVAEAPKIHALGSRHSFNGIADAGELVSLERMEQRIEIDRDAGTVTVNSGIPYGALAQILEHEGLALHNMASLPQISVAGAISTATHGSGDASGNLATAVTALELVTSHGDLLSVSRDDDDFAGMVVGLGALGVITRLTLKVEPSYLVRQEVFEHLGWDVLFDRFDEVTSSAGSVSLFTDFSESVNQVWLKSRVHSDQAEPLHDDLMGAVPATRMMHPVGTLSPDNCTQQLGIVGPWADRIPHFRMDAPPASGDEVQAEYMVSRQHAVEALQAVRQVADVIRPHLWISEIRTVAADDLWLSTAYGVDTVGIHFSWKNAVEAVARVLPIVEEALAPFEPRPHWGKLFMITGSDIAPRYERMPDFLRLAQRLDPRGAFRSELLEHVLG
jgi:xylitol oxidase